MDYKREIQIRVRIESIFNKNEDEFSSKAEYDDYLEQREDIIFNLIEGIDTKQMEAKIEDYKRINAESIGRNEARKAEEIRRRTSQIEAFDTQHEPLVDREGVSGTAAAFHGGQDAEPHQGMEYTANIPSGTAMAPTAMPLASRPSLMNIPQALGQQTEEEWRLMAISSGWSPEFQKKKALQTFWHSLQKINMKSGVGL